MCVCPFDCQVWVGRRKVETAMASDKIKRLARRRVQNTGEPYTLALRKVLDSVGEHADVDWESVIRSAVAASWIDDVLVGGENAVLPELVSDDPFDPQFLAVLDSVELLARWLRSELAEALRLNSEVRGELQWAMETFFPLEARRRGVPLETSHHGDPYIVTSTALDELASDSTESLETAIRRWCDDGWVFGELAKVVGEARRRGSSGTALVPNAIVDTAAQMIANNPPNDEDVARAVTGFTALLGMPAGEGLYLVGTEASKWSPRAIDLLSILWDMWLDEIGDLNAISDASTYVGAELLRHKDRNDAWQVLEQTLGWADGLQLLQFIDAAPDLSLDDFAIKLVSACRGAALEDWRGWLRSDAPDEVAFATAPSLNPIDIDQLSRASSTRIRIGASLLPGATSEQIQQALNGLDWNELDTEVLFLGPGWLTSAALRRLSEAGRLSLSFLLSADAVDQNEIVDLVLSMEPEDIEDWKRGEFDDDISNGPTENSVAAVRARQASEAGTADSGG
jgi:hypothetical protein